MLQVIKFVVVLNAPQAEAVLFGPEGVVPHLQPGAVVLCCLKGTALGFWSGLDTFVGYKIVYIRKHR